MRYREGDLGSGSYAYRFDQAGKFHFSTEMSEYGKQWMPFLEGEYVRV